MHDIPYIDIRESGPVELARKHLDGARNLIESSRDSFGIVSRIVSGFILPASDNLSRKWLIESANPYYNEIKEIAEIVRIKGAYTLNLSYEWGCTSGVFSAQDGPKLLRVLDWPLPALGKHTVIAYQKGMVGDFLNVTWPGLSGTFNALAEGRFAAAINQAPMRRHNFNIAFDWARNRRIIKNQKALPPAHLLRKVFETAGNYNEAKNMLTKTPVSIPVIYILSGINNGEGCVIERLENDADIKEIGGSASVCAANHFQSRFNGIGKGWMSRAKYSSDRAAKMAIFTEKDIANDNLDWLIHPIYNELNKLVMTANARTGKLLVSGTEGMKPVTNLFRN